MKSFLKLYQLTSYLLRIFCFKRKKRASKLIPSFLIIIFPFFAYSAGAEFSPKAIFIQLFNFSIFIFLFLFLIRKPLQAFFHKKQKDFFAFEEQALKLKKEKQETQRLWEKKLLDLEEKEKNIEQKAKEEALRFKTQKQQELEELSKKLKKISAFLLNLEKEKLKRESFSYWRSQLVKNVEEDLRYLAQSKEFQTEEQGGFLALLQKKDIERKKRILRK